MRLTKKTSKRVLALLISALMIISMLPVSVLTVFALSATALKTDIAEKTLYTEQATEFTFTTKASSEDVGKMVLGTFKLLDENGLDAQSAVKSLKYWDEANGCYSDFYGDFGPAETGFPLQNGATSKFCVTFNKAGNYKVKASIINFTDRSVLVAEDTEVTVKPYASALTTDIDTKTFVNNTEVEFTYTTVANAQRDTMVLGTFSVLDSESKDAKSCIKSLKYWDVTNNCYREFCGDFGPSATGFPLADATSKFRVTFNKAGTYTVNVAIKKFDDGEILCSNTKTITVQDNNSNLTTDITEKTFEVNEKVEFTYTTYAGDFADTMVLGKFTLKKNGKEVDKNSLKLEYWDVTNACYREFYGSFGPAATGFPLTDATSKFRVSFKETGKYDILVQMVKFADDTVVCENAATVEVKDTKAPVISEITGNATEWTGSDVTLKVVAADNSGSVAQYRLDGGEWQTSNTFNIKENGKYKFYAKDAAGNISDASAEIEVKYIDKVAPVIGVITLNPDDWTNKAVTVTVPATDVGINVILYRMDNGDWQKENTFTVSDNDIHEFYVKDSLGNENSAPAKIKADKYDAEAPVIKSITPNTTEWVSDKVTVTVDATDEGVMGIAYKLGKDGEWQSINTFDITENGTYQVYVKDALGNEIANPEEIVIGNIDKTAPEIVDFTSTTEDWTNKDVTISGTVKEAESGIAKLQYQIDKGEWTDLAFDKDGKFSITVSDECSVTYTFKCTDKVGNVSEGTYSKTVKIDKTPASVSVNEISDTWKNEQITVVGKVEDTASGIKSAVYDNGEGHEGDKGELDIHGSDFKFKTNVTKSGEYTYKITVIDEAGNETVIDNVTVKIDLENPVTSVKEADAWTNQKVDVVVTASDDAAGINKVYYKKNGGSEVEIGFIDGSYKFTIPNDADDNAEYEIYSVDNSGRKSDSVFYKAKIDVTKPQKPTITYTKALKYKLIDMVTFGLYNTQIDVTISSSDALSGLKEIKYYFDDVKHSAEPNEEGKITFAIKPENQYKVSAVAYDNAGNDSEKENVGTDGTKSDIGGVIADATAPKVVSASADIADITEWTNGEVKISGEVSDNLSSVEKVYYTKGESNTPVEITDFDGKNYKFTINAQSYSGKYYIYCVDYSTNVSEKKCVDVMMDNKNPKVDTLDFSPNVSTTEWANSVTVTGKVSDDLSGVSKVYWRQGAVGEEYEATLKEDGTYEFTVSELNYEGLILVGCYDNAGNKAEEKNFEIRIDSTKPVVDDVEASTSDWTNQKVTITGFAFDEKDGNVASGVKNVKYAYGEVTDGTAVYNVENGKYSFDVPATNYSGDVKVWCIDSAGNESDTVKVRVRMDVEQPEVDAEASTSDWTNQNVTITGFAFDEKGGNVASGVKNVKYAYGEVTEGVATYDEENGKYSFVVPATTNYNSDVKVWCIDNAGNESDVYPVAIKMDVEAPKNVEIKYSESVLSKVINAITFGFYKPELKVTVSATDNFALDEIKYTANGVNGKYDSTEAKLEGSKKVTHVSTNNGDADCITFNAPAEFKGKIEAVAYDCAGNSTEQTANDKNYDEVIVDNVAPKIDITYAADKENTKVRFVDKDNIDVDNFEDASQAFYNGKVNATIKVTENNFFEGDTKFDDDKKENGVIHEVGILVTKTDNDGTVTKTEYLPKSAAAKLFEDATETKEFTWTTDGNVHTCIIPYEEDADYEVTVKYVDFSGNKAEISANDGNVGKEEGSYTSKTVTVDTTAPVVTVVYDNNDVKATYGTRQYFTDKRTATITVTEHNFRAADFKATVDAKDSNDADVEVEKFATKLSTGGNWTKEGDVYTIKLAFTEEANYTFGYTYEDLAKNSAKDYPADDFTVDKTKPENLTVTYDGDIKTSVLDKVLNVLTFGYYDAKVRVIITADDAVSGVEHFVYSYVKGNGVSGVNASLENVVIESDKISRNGKTFTADFEIPKAVLQNTNQFNGTVHFTAYDRSGNESDKFSGESTIVVDNIKPTSTVTFNEPVQKVGDVSYYAGAINASIVINEANFFSEDVKVVVTKDGVNFPVKVDWKDNNVDVHTGTFTLEAPENHSLDGVYVVNVSYVDRSTNEMTPFVSNPLTIDTKVPVIAVSNVKHQSANNGETISFTVSATDTNMSLAGFKPNLKAVIKKDNGNNSFTFETIAIALGNAATTKNANGETVYTYSVNNLEVDGFYSLVCSAVDYANHSVSVINSATDAGGSANVETMNFSVNREGSVFWIETEHNDKYTGETFTDKLNGAYANDEVTVKLHEINVDKVDVNADKKTVFTLNDGSSSEDIELKEGENYSKNVVVGAGGWYETVYTLENSNFDHDGVYSLNVITYDKANNSNVNTKTEAGTISFTLDRTNPVISANIKDDQSVKDTQFWVEFEITETNLNAETVAVKLTDNEGKTVETEVEDLGNNKYRFLVDSGYNYTIEITAKDLAGNESELYKVEHFTVSTNILVLWYANTPLFWGSIGGTLLLAGAVILLVFLKKRKKNEDK